MPIDTQMKKTYTAPSTVDHYVTIIPLEILSNTSTTLAIPDF